MSAPAWMRRLHRSDAVLAPLSGGRGYGVFVGADRRRRPLARLSNADFRTALSDGLLNDAAGGYRLSADGRNRLNRLEQDSAQPFADQHRSPARRWVMEPDGARAVTAAMTPGPLARYLKPAGGKPALLNAAHASAAEIFMSDYQRSALMSRVTADWRAAPGGKHRGAPCDRADAPVSRIDAQARVMAAMEAVGPGLDQLLFAILIREVGMGQAERSQAWPERAGAAMLKLALDRLAMHYRLMARPRPPLD